jgi:hypothetical protein
MKKLSHPVNLSLKQKIQALMLSRWGIVVGFILTNVFVASLVVFGQYLIGGFILFIAVTAWLQSRRRQFIRESKIPMLINRKLREKYPHLTASETDLVVRGLRQFFMTYSRSGRKFVAMPSQVVDTAWHEFILHTKAYEAWCKTAFGRLLHHSPAEVLGKSSERNDGLRRTWYWACKEESIDPRNPSRLPLLFALDKKLNIPGGFTYVPDCKDINRQSGSGAQCGSDFGSSDGGSGDSSSFGGSESSGSESDGGSSSDSGGCGGGCGGGD